MSEPKTRRYRFARAALADARDGDTYYGQADLAAEALTLMAERDQLRTALAASEAARETLRAALCALMTALQHDGEHIDDSLAERCAICNAMKAATAALAAEGGREG